MINPNELRTGNQVLHKGAIIVIDGIDRSNESIMVEDKHIPIPLTDIDPVPLTTEWLEKHGFEIKNMDKIGIAWTIPIMHSANRVLGVTNMTYRTLVTFVAEPNNRVMLQTIYFVHPLQNLYRDLTGEELTIKETV